MAFVIADGTAPQVHRLRELIALLSLAAIAAKGSAEVTFSDGVAGVVEYSTRGGKNAFTTCRYFASDEYTTHAKYLGRYDEAVNAPNPLAFCLDNYENRTLD